MEKLDGQDREPAEVTTLKGTIEGAATDEDDQQVAGGSSVNLIFLFLYATVNSSDLLICCIKGNWTAGRALCFDMMAYPRS